MLREQQAFVDCSTEVDRALGMSSEKYEKSLAKYSQDRNDKSFQMELLKVGQGIYVNPERPPEDLKIGECKDLYIKSKEFAYETFSSVDVFKNLLKDQAGNQVPYIMT